MPGPNSQAQYEAGLQAGSIFSDHPADGKWESLQGGMCATWETSTMESSSMGDSRHQAPTMSPAWNTTVIVQTPVTKGGNGANYDSALPNH